VLQSRKSEIGGGMADALWSRVDRFIESRLVPKDPVLAAVLAANRAAGLPPIDVSPTQGQFLTLLVRIARAKAVLEIGTLGGYSSICLARGLPVGGRLVTLENEQRHADVATSNIAKAGLSDVVEVRLGQAIDSLQALWADGVGPFDLIFIDADKPNNIAYIDWALKLSQPGSVIVVDNVVRDGEIVRAGVLDYNAAGARDALERLGDATAFEATALQTVGVKGYDGFAIAMVR
jgi:predicted O-methyltransferase YrrM